MRAKFLPFAALAAAGLMAFASSASASVYVFSVGESGLSFDFNINTAINPGPGPYSNIPVVENFNNQPFSGTATIQFPGAPFGGVLLTNISTAAPGPNQVNWDGMLLYSGAPPNFLLGNFTLGSIATSASLGGNCNNEEDGNLESFACTGAFAKISASAVPEPATWAIMLLGFGGVGAVMRRRRKSAALLA